MDAHRAQASDPMRDEASVRDAANAAAGTAADAAEARSAQLPASSAAASSSSLSAAWSSSELAEMSLPIAASKGSSGGPSALQIEGESGRGTIAESTAAPVRQEEPAGGHGLAVAPARISPPAPTIAQAAAPTSRAPAPASTGIGSSAAQSRPSSSKGKERQVDRGLYPHSSGIGIGSAGNVSAGGGLPLSGSKLSQAALADVEARSIARSGTTAATAPRTTSTAATSALTAASASSLAAEASGAAGASTSSSSIASSSRPSLAKTGSSATAIPLAHTRTRPKSSASKRSGGMPGSHSPEEDDSLFFAPPSSSATRSAEGGDDSANFDPDEPSIEEIDRKLGGSRVSSAAYTPTERIGAGSSPTRYEKGASAFSKSTSPRRVPSSPHRAQRDLDKKRSEEQEVDLLLGPGETSSSPSSPIKHDVYSKQEGLMSLGRGAGARGPSTRDVSDAGECMLSACQRAGPGSPLPFTSVPERSHRGNRTSSIAGIFDLESDSPPGSTTSLSLADVRTAPEPASSPSPPSKSSSTVAGRLASRPGTVLRPHSSSSGAGTGHTSPSSRSSPNLSPTGRGSPRSPSPLSEAGQFAHSSASALQTAASAGASAAPALGLRSISPSASSSSLRYEYGVVDDDEEEERNLSRAGKASVQPRSSYDASHRVRTQDPFRPSGAHSTSPETPLDARAVPTAIGFGTSAAGRSPPFGPTPVGASTSGGLGSALKLSLSGGARHFDTAPSFSSPLAHAATLQDLADLEPEQDMELDELIAPQDRAPSSEEPRSADVSGSWTSEDRAGRRTLVSSASTSALPPGSASSLMPNMVRSRSPLSQLRPASGEASPSIGTPPSTTPSHSRSVSGRSGSSRIISSSELKLLPRERMASGGNPVPAGAMGPPTQPASSSAKSELHPRTASGSSAGSVLSLPSRSIQRPSGSALSDSVAGSPSSHAAGSFASPSNLARSSSITRARKTSLGPAAAPVSIAGAKASPVAGAHHGSQLSLSSNLSASSTESSGSVGASPSQRMGASALSLATSWSGTSMASSPGPDALNARRSVGPSFAAPSALGNTAPGAAAGTGRRKRRPSAPVLPAQSHRRARSLGGVLLADLALANSVGPGSPAADASSSSPGSNRSYLGPYVGSPIGGPDGVDPNLVAAMNRNEMSFPGTPLHENTRLHSSTAQHSTPTHASSSVVLSSPVLDRLDRERKATTSSSPSSAGSQSGSLQQQRGILRSGSVSSGMLLGRRRPDMAWMRGEGAESATNLPSAVSTEAEKQAQAAGIVPSPPLGGPSSYQRSRVRSQTLASATSPVIQPSDTLGGRAGGSMGPRSGSTLAEAIRLQRVPTAVRLAGDLFIPSSPSFSKSNSGNFSSSYSGHGGSTASLGLGIGGLHPPASSPDGDAGPHTPAASRSSSPQLEHRKISRDHSTSTLSLAPHSDIELSETEAEDAASVSGTATRRRYSTLSSGPTPSQLFSSSFAMSPGMGSRSTRGSAAKAEIPLSRDRSRDTAAALGPLFALPSHSATTSRLHPPATGEGQDQVRPPQKLDVVGEFAVHQLTRMPADSYHSPRRIWRCHTACSLDRQLTRGPPASVGNPRFVCTVSSYTPHRRIRQDHRRQSQREDAEVESCYWRARRSPPRR